MNEIKGKTAQYWITYSQKVDLILLMQRAIKSNDISSLIRQKSESQNGDNKKTEHA